jgi:hypothetical protein
MGKHLQQLMKTKSYLCRYLLVFALHPPPKEGGLSANCDKFLSHSKTESVEVVEEEEYVKS